MAKKKKVNKKQKLLSAKIAKIMKDGVRRNTHAPLSKTNKRRPVSQKQAVAIAESMMGNKKMAKQNKMMKSKKKMMA